jgi:3-hydroxyisobutyrate dehydrogenase-like beta-hydroxyacid dehydrogenase
MGGPMALNLQKRAAQEGGGLVVFDAKPEASGVPAAAASGARVAFDLAEVARLCDRIVLCLPDGSAVSNALMGRRGLRDHLSPDALVIDCSTTDPAISRRAAARLPCRFVDAPVSGERARAESGTLTSMVGASSKDFARAEAVLSGFASEVIHVGGPGCGQLAKAFNNALYNVSVAAMAEVLPLARRTGLDLEAFSRAVGSGTGQSFGFDKFSPLVLARTFEAPAHGYPMAAAFKDMETVAAAAAEAQLELRLVDAARRTYEEALELKLGSQHKGAMVKVWERKLGVVAEPGRGPCAAAAAAAASAAAEAEQKLKCGLCGCTDPENSVSLPCGHRFCKQCLKPGSGTSACPTCNRVYFPTWCVDVDRLPRTKIEKGEVSDFGLSPSTRPDPSTAR